MVDDITCIVYVKSIHYNDLKIYLKISMYLPKISSVFLVIHRYSFNHHYK